MLWFFPIALAGPPHDALVVRDGHVLMIDYIAGEVLIVDPESAEIEVLYAGDEISTAPKNEPHVRRIVEGPDGLYLDLRPHAEAPRAPVASLPRLVDGEVADHPVPDELQPLLAHGVSTRGPDGPYQAGLSNEVWRVDGSQRIPVLWGALDDSFVMGLTVDQDGHLWVADGQHGRIVEVRRRPRVRVEVDTPPVVLMGIEADGDELYVLHQSAAVLTLSRVYRQRLEPIVVRDHSAP